MKAKERSDLSGKELEIFDDILQRRGRIRGPYAAWMQSPKLCEKMDAFNAYIRQDSKLSTRIAELATLVISRHYDAAYPWNAHLKKAIENGISQQVIDDLAHKKTPIFKAEDEQVFYDFAQEILNNHFVSDEIYASAQRVYGEDGIVEIIAMIGSFSMLAMVLNTFEMDLQPNSSEPFSDIANYKKI